MGEPEIWPATKEKSNEYPGLLMVAADEHSGDVDDSQLNVAAQVPLAMFQLANLNGDPVTITVVLSGVTAIPNTE